MVRFFSLPALAAFVYAAATASAQQLSTDGQFTIASPNAGGIFVAGELLPCVWHLDDTTPAGFALNVYLESSTVANFNTIAIAAPANVEKTSQWLLPGNGSVYEHIVNYALPRTLTAGSYAVVYESVNTQSNTSIAITINAARASSSASSSSSATGSDSKPSSSSDNNESASGRLIASMGGVVSAAIVAALAL